MKKAFVLAGILGCWVSVAHGYMSPETGRWMNRDPIGDRVVRVLTDEDVDAARLLASDDYLFVENAPVGQVDPLGLKLLNKSQQAKFNAAMKALGGDPIFYTVNVAYLGKDTYGETIAGGGTKMNLAFAFFNETTKKKQPPLVTEQKFREAIILHELWHLADKKNKDEDIACRMHNCYLYAVHKWDGWFGCSGKKPPDWDDTKKTICCEAPYANWREYVKW